MHTDCDELRRQGVIPKETFCCDRCHERTNDMIPFFFIDKEISVCCTVITILTSQREAIPLSKELAEKRQV